MIVSLAVVVAILVSGCSEPNSLPRIPNSQVSIHKSAAPPSFLDALNQYLAASQYGSQPFKEWDRAYKPGLDWLQTKQVQPLSGDLVELRNAGITALGKTMLRLKDVQKDQLLSIRFEVGELIAFMNGLRFLTAMLDNRPDLVKITKAFFELVPKAHEKEMMITNTIAGRGRTCSLLKPQWTKSKCDRFVFKTMLAERFMVGACRHVASRPDLCPGKVNAAVLMSSHGESEKFNRHVEPFFDKFVEAVNMAVGAVPSGMDWKDHERAVSDAVEEAYRHPTYNVWLSENGE